MRKVLSTIIPKPLVEKQHEEDTAGPDTTALTAVINDWPSVAVHEMAQTGWQA